MDDEQDGCGVREDGEKEKERGKGGGRVRVDRSPAGKKKKSEENGDRKWGMYVMTILWPRSPRPSIDTRQLFAVDPKRSFSACQRLVKLKTKAVHGVHTAQRASFPLPGPKSVKACRSACLPACTIEINVLALRRKGLSEVEL